MIDARQSGLARLMLRWPERRAKLRLFAATNGQFIELCEAYELACRGLEHWAHDRTAVCDERVAEYRSLIFATEEDISEIIS